LVTGASRGIGRAIAERLTTSGVRVIAHYHRRREEAEQTGAFKVVQADLSSLEGIEGMTAELVGTQLDVLVNNAGIWKSSPLGATSRDQLDELIGVNLRGVFWVTQCALPLLNDGARVINISSVAARIGVSGGRSMYGATKAAIDALTRNWALELAPRGILVNAVAPGYVTTDMTTAHFSDPVVYQRALDRHPLGRLGAPDDVAGAVEFLCSDQARFITGQILNVSGGFVV
jgi:NAD(P)-dependent dehydrogenase (short-subunit alcohol dehydrogenase family)